MRGTPVALGGALALLIAAPVSAQVTKIARITYVTTTAVYLDAGRLDGLSDSALVDVVRGGATIAVLRVAFLASHQASCTIVSAAGTPIVGDSARFTPSVPARDSAVAALPPKPRPVAGSAARPHGRLGVEYFALQLDDTTGTSLSQPSLSVRLDGPMPGMSSMYLSLDVRARRSYTVLADGSAVTDGRNRVYQGAVTFGSPTGRTRLTLGRLIAGNLASIGLFDGLLLSVNHARWSWGAFTGSQPEPQRLGYSNDILQGGAYVQSRSRPGSASPWSVTLGLSGSYQDAHANREFAYAQASVMTRWMSVFVTQEVDYYRQWKRLAGTGAVSPTSTFAILQIRPARLVTLDAGFDNRRNVLLYRDAVNPETSFDDTYRQGIWGGVSLQPVRHVRLSGDARVSRGDAVGSATAYTGSITVERLTRFGASLRGRATRYENEGLAGWLFSGALNADPLPFVRLELNGGHRSEHGMAAVADAVHWLGAGIDLTLGRAWYLMGSATWQRGGLETQNQVYAGASWRF